MSDGHFKNLLTGATKIAVKERISYDTALADFRRSIATEAIDAEEGNKAAAARRLGVSRTGIGQMLRGGWRKKKGRACAS